MADDGDAADLVRYLLKQAAIPFQYPLASDQRIYWLYLLSSGVIAIGVFALSRPGPGALRKMLRFLLPREVFTHASAVVDYKFFIVNRILFVALVTPVLLNVPTVSYHTVKSLLPLVGGPGTRVAGGFDHVLYTTCMVVAGDFATFFAHYLQHRVPLLWEFHKTHHSAEVLTPITVYRMHPVDDILSGVMIAGAMGVTDGVFRVFYASSPVMIVLLNLNLFVFLFFLTGYNLRHSHVWLNYPRWLSRILISPAQHQIHHSAAPEHHDRNLGFILAVWDRLFGTLYVPERRVAIRYGLADDEHRELNSVWRLYARPFRKALERLAPRGGEAA